MALLGAVGFRHARPVGAVRLGCVTCITKHLAILQRRLPAQAVRQDVVKSELAGEELCRALLASASAPVPCGKLDG
jgi:hypothetical protein